MTQSAHDEDVVRDDELLFDRLREPANGHGRTRESVREGDMLAGKYSVDRIRRRSGLLVSAEARHVDLGERVLMMLLPTDGRTYPDTVARFLRDARAAARIRSEHAARVTDVGWLVSGSPYAVTEYPRGNDLAELVRGRGPLPIVEALDYVMQACEAVAESHALDIVHASLSPSNLLVSRGLDGTPLVKVLGFGVSETWMADPADDRSTGPVDPVSLAQALAYFAPEQIRDPSALDARVDVWALGAVLHELLTGLPVYRSRSMLALATMIAADPPPPLAAHRPDVPAELEEVILTCLAKDPAARFPSVGELTLALQPFVSYEGQNSVARISRITGLSSRPPAVTQRLYPHVQSQVTFVPPAAPIAVPASGAPVTRAMGAPGASPLSSRPVPTPMPPPLPRSDAPNTSRSLTPPPLSTLSSAPNSTTSTSPKTSRPVRLDSMSSYGPPESDFSARFGKHVPWVLAAMLGIGTAIAAQVVIQRQRHATTMLEGQLVPQVPSTPAPKPLAEPVAVPAALAKADPVPPAALPAAPAALPLARPAPAVKSAPRAKESDPYDDAPKSAPSKRSKGLFDDAD